MSFISDLTSLGGNAGNFSEIVSKVQQAIASGDAAHSPVGKEVVELMKQAIPDIDGAPDMIQKIDDLLPDSLQSQFGFTPEVMTFMKEALGAHAAPTRAV